MKPKFSRRTKWFFAVPIIVVSVLAIAVAIGMHDFPHPVSEPWPQGQVYVEEGVEDLDYDLRAIGFANIAKNQNVDPARSGGLKFYFSWPEHYWIAIEALSDGGAAVAATEIGCGEDEEKCAYSFTISEVEYQAFLFDFDEKSGGFRIHGFHYDGWPVAFERWSEGSAISYEDGDASDIEQDYALARMVVDLVKKDAGAAEAGFGDFLNR